MVALAGSTPSSYPNAVITGPAHPDERLEITLVMNPHDRDGLHDHLAKMRAGLAEPLSAADYARQHATSDIKIQKVLSFAASFHFSVVDADPLAHRVIVSGTVLQANIAFGVDLQAATHANGGVYRVRTGDVHLPQELDGIVIAVLGLENHPIAKPYLHVAPHAQASSFLPTEVADLYGFPAGDGHGQCIAIIELGGGYRVADLQNYFLNEVKLPQAPVVTSVSVSHGMNAPTGSANGADGEVMLDIEVAGSIAPAATIAVYFCPNTDAGFLNAITTAMHDSLNKPTVMSISWGGPEAYWSPQAMQAFDAAFAQATILGINVCVASGDNGSSDGIADGSNHVDFPASSPHVIACGGTNIQVANGAIVSESVWNSNGQLGASGGGMSKQFYSFVWQKSVCPHMRGVPDVAGNADPNSGYRVLVDGQSTVIGGTSAVAPLWAALIARINAHNGRQIGYAHAKMYANPSAFNDITAGNNGKFVAAKGWDACTGLGSPRGTALQSILN